MDDLPFDARNDPERRKAFLALHEDVPAYMRRSLRQLMLPCFQRRASAGVLLTNEATVLAAERFLRRELHPGISEHVAGMIINDAFSDPAFFFSLVEFHINEVAQGNDFLASEYERVLRDGSAWTLQEASNGRWHVVKRLPDAVMQTFEHAVTASEKADPHLRDALVYTYKQDPDPSRAYHEAVRAVEAVMFPVIIPNDFQATFGRALGELRHKPFTVRVPTGSQQPNPKDALTRMLERLWQGQIDRHASTDPDVPLNVSLEDAQDAVHLAAFLVQFFASGGVINNAP